MALRKLSIPFNAGSKEKISPKNAPFGVLKLGKNLRHREQGGLGMRNGYSAVSMTGMAQAYDVFDYQGRLCALGEPSGSGYPSDVFEFLNLTSPNKWRASTANPGFAFTLNAISPFGAATEVAGMPQPEGGVSVCDVAIGGGYVCTCYHVVGSGKTFVVTVDQATNQTIQFECISASVFAGALLGLEKLTFSAGKFYFVATKLADNSITAAVFQPNTAATAWASFVVVDGANAAPVSALDMVPVTNTTARVLAIGFDRGTSTSLSVKMYTSAAAVSSTATVAGTNTTALYLEADDTDNVLTVMTIEGFTSAQLRTFTTSAGALIAGPANVGTTAGVGGVCRIRAATDKILVGINDANGNFVVQQCNSSTLTLLSFVTIRQFVAQSRMVPAHPGFVIGGSVQPNTNALFYGELFVAHMLSRDLLKATTNQGLSAVSTAGTTFAGAPSKLAWCSKFNPGVTSIGVPTVTLLDFRSTARVQATQYGGLHYAAGAPPWVYDGRAATEASFNEIPLIISATASSAGGSLAPSARYSYTAHWEFTYADGSFVPSAPASVVTAATGAADNRVTLVVTTPHSLKVALGSTNSALSCTLVISRTVWSTTTIDPSTGVVGFQFSQLRRTTQVDLPGGMGSYGATVTVVDSFSDTFVATQGVVYTQGDRGEFSGPVENDALEPCQYIAASESRLHAGGLVRPFELQISKDAFLGEPIEWSQLSQFYTQLDGRVTGVYAMDQRRFAFTRDDVFVVPSAAPDDEGKGSVGDPVRLPSAGGLKDWRSFLLEQGGLWYQEDDDKLMRIPRGGGTPEWEGADVQKTLAAFPVITAAAKHRGDHIGLFAINDAASTTARLLVRDLLFGTWFLDTPPLTSNRGIESMCVTGRAVAYVSGAFVFVQTPGSFTDGTSSFITCEAITQPIYPFGLGGYGLVQDVLLTAEYRGDCVLGLGVSYDDGLTFTTLASFTVSGLTSGAQVQRRWALPQDVTSSVVLDITVSTNGAPSEGLILNEATLLVQDEAGLRELDPGNCA